MGTIVEQCVPPLESGDKRTRGDNGSVSAGSGRTWRTATRKLVKMEAPGFEPGQLDMQVSGNVLTIKAEKKRKKGKSGVR